MTEGICCRFQSAPEFAGFESPQSAALTAPLEPKGSLGGMLGQKPPLLRGGGSAKPSRRGSTGSAGPHWVSVFAAACRNLSVSFADSSPFRGALGAFMSMRQRPRLPWGSRGLVLFGISLRTAAWRGSGRRCRGRGRRWSCPRFPGAWQARRLRGALRRRKCRPERLPFCRQAGRRQTHPRS